MAFFVQHLNIGNTGKINPIQIKASDAALKAQLFTGLIGKKMDNFRLNCCASQCKGETSEKQKKQKAKPQEQPEKSHQGVNAQYGLVLAQKKGARLQGPKPKIQPKSGYSGY